MKYKLEFYSIASIVAISLSQCWHYLSCVHAFSWSIHSTEKKSNVPLGSSSANPTFTYTHLECNGQLWHLRNDKSSLSVVIDPLASQLDFGIPWGYRANKKCLSEHATLDLICSAKPSHCLLTMGLDDHTHLPTINILREKIPMLKYIVAPSAEKKLLDCGVDASFITVLRHGQSRDLIPGSSLTATPGALVGPPWQMRENGYLLKLGCDNAQKENCISIYYEPHNDVIFKDIEDLNEHADIVVLPVTKQSLPASFPREDQFTLVHGGERALETAELMRAKVIIPLENGVLETKGPLSNLVVATGSTTDFEKLVEEKNNREMQLKRRYANIIMSGKSTPGVPLTISRFD